MGLRYLRWGAVVFVCAGAAALPVRASEDAPAYVFGDALSFSAWPHAVTAPQLDLGAFDSGLALAGEGERRVAVAEIELDPVDFVARLDLPENGGSAVTLGVAYGARLSPSVRLRVGPVVGYGAAATQTPTFGPAVPDAMAGMEVELFLGERLSFMGSAGAAQLTSQPLGEGTRYFTGLSLDYRF